ncbi:hypothetical protein ACW14Y_41715 [Kitasatospora sp. cg17-2]
MNRFGEQALAHWQEHRPVVLRSLEDPQEYFTELGEEISRSVESLARSLAATTPTGEGYLARLQRLQTAHSEAESTVLREVLLLNTEPEQE